eukprot:TRINITY_DN9497_c0_g1_i1.p1 TRINITY_DN9497_c0_g1~~TRINITY_DN9497_c0_g1_i1.p1  ORF type:complete len:131 (+),score=15.40 TRINITY_DN9497_c0_g1_i1:287-679(+)
MLNVPFARRISLTTNIPLQAMRQICLPSLAQAHAVFSLCPTIPASLAPSRPQEFAKHAADQQGAPCPMHTACTTRTSRTTRARAGSENVLPKSAAVVRSSKNGLRTRRANNAKKDELGHALVDDIAQLTL